MNKLLLYIFLLSGIAAWGNNYNYEASVSKVNNDGFHKILLSPAVTSELRSNFSDIRIYDSEKVEIPYLLEKENRINEKELFVEYKIITKQHFKSREYTRIVIHNPNKTKINNIILEIRNADVRKRLKLNASDDNKNWYVLKDNYYYNSINSNNSTSELRVLNFPLSDYEYYELLIDDYFDKPINVIRAGCYDLLKESGKYTKQEGINIAMRDTLKQTIISIPVNNYVDKMSFAISAPRYYNRRAEIFVHEYIAKQEKTKVYDRTIGGFNLISNSSNAIALNNLRADTIFVRIFNNDNQPLTIDSINAYQLNKYLIAELDTDKLYHIAYSDEKAQSPVYDLKYFTDIIPDNIDVVNVHSITDLSSEGITNSDETKQIAGDNFNLSNYWLWISIVVIALLLAYMSYVMLKEKKVE